ncbi:GGDEF domain-containing protein [Occallatibacter riparius]|uniref:GGDEF domain-containing protein n=1 Tax=Occallatibacter riparius TaxID=1002689 RepID=A0A9J7BU07_9BACT|nr:GGDEF domain-containing protein [Occallatibacter riparius]UWZ86364.1 GGDEF domain-containing protein [Occallatibacter riparius]
MFKMVGKIQNTYCTFINARKGHSYKAAVFERSYAGYLIGWGDAVNQMQKWISRTILLVGLAIAPALHAAPLTSLQAIHKLTNEQATAHLPVEFDATVTFYRGYENTLFVQDGDAAIFVQPLKAYNLSPGDRIHIRGNTQESFRPLVAHAEISLIGHSRLPQPLLARFEEIIHARYDCRFVRVRGRVASADITLSSNRPSSTLQVVMEGGTAEVQIEANEPGALSALLDAEVEVSGAVSGRFDGKMEMTGIVLHTQSLAQVKVITPQKVSPWSAPLTPMGEIMANYRVQNLSERVRVQGTVTYFIPGSVVVLQNGPHSLWVNTKASDGVQIGDFAEATGLPGIHDGFLRIVNGEILDSHKAAPVEPVRVTWRELTQSHHVFDLVSTEANVVAKVREGSQDEYVLQSEGHLFSAIYRHPGPSGGGVSIVPRMKDVPTGSRVRVTGICILEDSNPFNVNVPFDLLIRSFDDVELLAYPSPLTVANLLKMVGLLLVLLVSFFLWGWMLQRKVERQGRILAAKSEAEVALARHNAEIEHRRSRILEDLNGLRPLNDLLEEITALASFRLRGAPCWCEFSDGMRVGSFQSNPGGRRMVREEIPGRSGAPLGVLCAAMDPGTAHGVEEQQAFFQGTRLATLAIETRKAFTDLVHRSEYDLLTDVHNRFSLDKQIGAVIARAKKHESAFGLIYADLDEFKQVNDVYGHRVGDMYLQEACARMKHQLRADDVLARLGGDEFAALIPGARGRSDVEEIASRLERCFNEPFHLDGYVLHGSVSVGIAMYPEDGTTRDSLLIAADAAMYVAKHTGRTKEA